MVSGLEDFGVWKVSADTGGTFTDVVAVSPAGDRFEAKVLSSGCLRIGCVEVVASRMVRVDAGDLPDGFLDGVDLGEGRKGVSLAQGILTFDGPALEKGGSIDFDSGLPAPILGAYLATGTSLRGELPPLQLRVATTRGTNALLEKKGARVGLVVSEGWEDILRIGDQTRSDLFARPIPPRGVLFSDVAAAAVRFDREGRMLRQSESWQHPDSSDVDVWVVSFCNSYLNPEEERAWAERLADQVGKPVVASTSVSALPGYLRRTETGVIEGYLSPILDSYLNEMAEVEGVRGIEVMTSAGGIVERDRFRAVDSLLSGPAGGMMGAVTAAGRAGIGSFLAFDMGGTSTDVSRFDGSLAYRSELSVGEARLFSEALRIDTVAAGGGSICGFDGFGFTVGPDSAGADPGPACYGRGGPLALTDVHLLLGRIDPQRFRFPLDVEGSQAAFQDLLHSAGQAGAGENEQTEILEGLLAIADERMAGALKGISVRDGLDPADFALLSFGGGGGLHACSLAARLGMKRILQPGSAGILSADGLATAVPERVKVCSVLLALETFEESADAWFADLDREVLDLLDVDEDADLLWTREVFLRLRGQESTLACEWEKGLDLAEAFHRQFESIFGFRQEGLELEVATIRVRVRLDPGPMGEEEFPEGDFIETRRGQFLDGESLVAGNCGCGPCVISQRFGTLVVDAGWKFRVGYAGSIQLERTDPVEDDPAVFANVEAVEHELFRSRFAATVDAMGEMLRRTALSVNIRERLDFSCALLDGNGYLVVNAPHIPVHLGALGHCVRAVSEILEWKPGDIAVTNHPGLGGSHLPDVTVMAPVFAGGRRPVAFVAVRAHHAEIGGKRAGSMPADADSLAEEGVVIEPFHLFRNGEENLDRLRNILTGKEGQRYPSRAVETNLADVLSQVAAVRAGVHAVTDLVERVGADKVAHFLERILRQSEDWMRKAVEGLDIPPEGLKAEVTLDGGGKICVAARPLDGGRLLIDGSGTEPGRGSFQCPFAVALSAILYACRLLVDRDIPLNEGLLRCVDIEIPEGCLLSASFAGGGPEEQPPVVAGNVEVSQRFVEALVRLFRLEADSQGTMNNVIFGNREFSHYETVAGGSGASGRGRGSSGVQVHMTNTAITDPEVLEHRFPVRVERFAIRQGSGGSGKNPGGDGVVREYFFEEEVELSLLTQHRDSAPLGLARGGPASPGRQVLINPSGVETELPYACTITVPAGSRLRVETPGGGGWGDGFDLTRIVRNLSCRSRPERVG